MPSMSTTTRRTSGRSGIGAWLTGPGSQSRPGPVHPVARRRKERRAPRPLVRGVDVTTPWVRRPDLRFRHGALRPRDHRHRLGQHDPGPPLRRMESGDRRGGPVRRDLPEPWVHPLEDVRHPREHRLRGG
ncbi:hypothetical protein NOCARDAX2BIS_90041 [Nocardioides sp. AX2bis]|nr:hypothetical protein NOCARDAX2BIS_90041 [Nocardioides sp. AX2bis]